MAEPPAAPVTADEKRRQLLTKRTTTVNKLRREICDRRNHLPSATQSSRGIPVPLWPKESWLKYTQRFERWLAKRGQSLAALRENPKKERSYWFSYAYTRVGPIDTEVDAFGRKRSYSYTSNMQYEPESKRLRRDMDDGVEISRQFRGLETADDRLTTRRAAAYSGEEQSRQLLSSLSERAQASLPRVRIEQHVHDGKLSGVSLGSQHQLKEIPVSLYPGKPILPRRSQLAEEHESRCKDAQQKSTSGLMKIRATPTPENYDSLRQRKDGSHTHTAKPKASLPGPPSSPSASSDPVAAAMNFAGDAKRKSEQVETITRTPPCQTEVRENVKNSAQLPASTCSDESAHLSDLHPEPSSADITLQLVPESGAQTAKVTSSPEALPSWAASLIDRVQELETQMAKLQREVEICHNTAGTRSVLNRELLCDESDNLVELCAKARDDANSLSPSTNPPQSSLYEENSAIRMKSDHNESQGRVEADMESSPPRLGVREKNFSHRSDQASPAPLLVNSGLKRQLIEEYKHLNNLIKTNETAVNDALEFAKTIKEIDDVQAMENHREIMELVVAINQKKEQRSSALAALITCSWTGDEESLVSLLEEDSSPPGCTKHDELAAVFTQMEMKTKEMGHLEEQLSDQTPLVRAFNPFVLEAGKALQDKKTREVSVRLSKEKKAKGELEKECRQMSMCFLQSDAEVRKLVKQSLV